MKYHTVEFTAETKKTLKELSKQLPELKQYLNSEDAKQWDELVEYADNFFNIQENKFHEANRENIAELTSKEDVKSFILTASTELLSDINSSRFIKGDNSLRSKYPDDFEFYSEVKKVLQEYNVLLKDKFSSIDEVLTRIKTIKSAGREFSGILKEVIALKESLYESTKIVVDNSDETKQLKNDIIDIHHSVMSNNNKVVQEQILRPLTTDHIEKQAELVDSKTSKRKYRTLLNDTWQRDKLIQLASGKIGVGTTSLDVTFHSIAQIANTTGSPLTLMTKEGKPLSLKIDNVKSVGKLGLEQTLDKKEYISVANSEMQNAAVDNASVQAFGKLNINDLTFAAERTLRLLGFDKGKDGNNIRYMLLSQPIVKDYVQMMKKQMSALSEYDPDFEAKLIDKLLTKYNTHSNVDLGFKNDLGKDFFDATASITSERLTQSLNFPVKEEGESDATYEARVNAFHNLQGRALDLFLVADFYGKEIAKVQQIMNIDSRGFGKSIPEVIQAVVKAGKTINGGSISNVSELIGVVLEDNSPEWNAIKDTPRAKDFVAFGKFRIKPSHISGSALAYGLGSAFNMWKHLFPYQQSGFMGVVNSILEHSRIDNDASITKLADLQSHVLTEFKRAIYSDVRGSGLSTEEVEDVRKKLFFDTDENQSLASYINDIKPLMNNSFINRLETHVVNTGLPSRISYNNAAADDIDENIIYDAAFSLFSDNKTLPDFNGEEMTTRKLMQYLTLYAYAGDPIQQATQFVKFIPNEVLEISGTNQYSRDINKRIMANDEELYVGFERQYFQHNPGKTTQIPMEMLSEMTGIKGPDIVKAESFTATQSFVEKYGEVKYVSYYIDNLNTVNKKNRWRLFELLQDGTYHRIPILGVFGMNEYQLGQNFVKSIVNNVSVNKENVVSLQKKDMTYTWARRADKNYEVSSKGDTRFSAFNAKLKPKTSILTQRGHVLTNKESSIEELYQVGIKGYDTIREGKGKPPKYNISREDSWKYYKGLWKAWADQNPELMKELSERAYGRTLTDTFANTEINQARALSEILNEMYNQTYIEPESKVKSSQQVVPDKKADIISYHYDNGDSISSILKSIALKSANENFKNLAEYFDKFAADNKIEIVVNKSLGLNEARYFFNANKIELSNKFSSTEEFERAILHEFLHKLTIKKLREPGNTDIKKNLLKLKTQARKVLADKYGAENIAKVAEDFKKNKTLSEVNRQRFYGVLTHDNDISGVEEFVTQIMTEPEFQKELGQTKAEGFDLSILERFFNLIKRLLTRTGILPESVTAQAVNQVLNLIEGEVLQTKTEVSDVFLSGLKPQISVYNYNPTNVSEQLRETYKNIVLDALGKPKIDYTETVNDKFYKFTFPDGLIIETPAKGQMLSIPKVSQKIVEISKKDPGYDIKFLVGLNKLAEESKKQSVNVETAPSAGFLAGLGKKTKSDNDETGQLRFDEDGGGYTDKDFEKWMNKSPSTTTFEDFRDSLQKKCK